MRILRTPTYAAILCAIASTCGRDATAAPPPIHFAVISDLHIPRDGRIPAALQHSITDMIASHPRFVVITGDFTDGEPDDPMWRSHEAPRWWEAVHRLVAPIRAAGIPVLPVAGNHDSYLPIYRADYARAWRDLDAWAAPLRITGNRQPRSGLAIDAAPFCYGVDVDGVHLTLAHIVEQAIDPAVARFLARDLAAARGARLRIVFGHVPLASAATTPPAAFLASFGRILADGHADMYVAGHEHLAWDDQIELPGGAHLRQVIVGTPLASWRFGPSAVARERARCRYGDGVACCTMPETAMPFRLEQLHGQWFEAPAHSFALFTIDGTGGITA